MAISIRRRIAAIATCLVVVCGTFGYMQRNVSDAAQEAAQTAECSVPDHRHDHQLGFLCLYGEDD
jgi:hypothetical protein